MTQKNIGKLRALARLSELRKTHALAELATLNRQASDLHGQIAQYDQSVSDARAGQSAAEGWTIGAQLSLAALTGWSRAGRARCNIRLAEIEADRSLARSAASQAVGRQDVIERLTQQTEDRAARQQQDRQRDHILTQSILENLALRPRPAPDGAGRPGPRKVDLNPTDSTRAD